MSDHAGRHQLISDAAQSFPQLSIVIPCYNSAATLGEQLSAIAAQVTRYSWEVLVADNRSRDDTVAMAKAFRDAFRISGSRVGAPAC